jgi:hydrogenase maturation protein HypF
VACDLHPDYLSTGYAAALTGVERVEVQHHHAHVASCMAEHGLEGPVIGVSADGTGLGTDGKIWGGEVLVAELHAFTRFAHLEYVPMPGADAAIRNPWRMAASYLVHALGDGSLDFLARVWPGLPSGEIEGVRTMVRQGLNSPLTSSLGRLFDGVASLCGIRARAAHEGQAAVELEAAADDTEPGDYEADPDFAVSPAVVPVAGIVRGVVLDLSRGVPAARVSARFHNTVVRLFTRLCERARDGTGLGRVVLSGGAFQNARLLARLPAALEAHGFEVFTHEKVPANDGGISLGQAVAAAAIRKRSRP